MNDFKRGLKNGIPIGLGYLSVSFSFGIIAVTYGFMWWQAVLISMTTLTSAGQLAGISLMLNPGQYIDMLVSQLTINVRYSFMSVSLTQKTSPQFKGLRRLFFGFFMTDEIFAVAACEKEVSTKFFSGLTVFPYIGWTLGTLLGTLIGNVLPDIILSSLCLAIYGMFIAIVVPVVRDSSKVLAVVVIAVVLSVLFYYLPALSSVSTGLTISICAVLAAVAGAVFFPVKEDDSV